ncbi:MAG: aminoglycoside adenylyltransferase family protein [Candidatus Nanopelagicales bacterium]
MTYAVDSRQTDAVLTTVGAVLASDVIGVYLHGSAVMGGLRSLSDLDMLVVTRQPTTAIDRRALVEGLFEISGSRASRGPARPVELTIVVQSAVRPWRYPPMCEFLYGEWLRDAYERGEIPVPEPSTDLATLLTMVLAGDAPLIGPPPRHVLDPVPHDDLRASVVAGVPQLLDEIEDDTRNVVLTLARIWRTLATGEVTSKDAAADWALQRLPIEQRPVLQRARDIYVGDHPEEWSHLIGVVPHFAEHIVAEIHSANVDLRGVGAPASPPRQRPDARGSTGPGGIGPARTR